MKLQIVNKSRPLIVALTIALSLLGTTSGTAGEDQGQVSRTPWSGYWWPLHEARILGPLAKYDRVTGKNSVAWERRNHPQVDENGRTVPRWHGYCHAWAASAVREVEPTKARSHRAGDAEVALAIGDQKGLLAVCHDADEANSYGDRFGDGIGSENRDDLAPDQLWQLLKLYIKQQNSPLVLDIESGPEVWNFPAYAYKVSYEPQGDSGRQLAQLSIWCADDFVQPDYVGVKVRRQTYWFTFELRGNKIVAGSGKWHGPSAKDHPDFAWFPVVQRTNNPQVEYQVVRKLVGQAAGGQPPAPTPAPSENQPAPPPTDPDNPPAPSPPTTAPPTPAPPAPSPSTPPAVPAPAPAAPSTSERPTPIFALSPWELLGLVANKTSSFPLDVTVDRFDGGEYQIGDSIVVSGSSSVAGYLYLLHLNADGALSLLYPQPGQDNRIEAKKRFEWPGPQDSFVIEATEPYGVSRIKAIVTTRPISFSGLAAVDEPTQTTQNQTPPARTKPEQSTPAQIKPEQVKPAPTQTPAAQAAPGVDQRAPGRPARVVFRLQRFLWPPSLAKEVTQQLAQLQRGEQLLQLEPLRLDPAKILGKFAQDEVAFYVGPTRKPPVDQSKPDQSKPVQAKPEQVKPEQAKPEQAAPAQQQSGRKATPDKP